MARELIAFLLAINAVGIAQPLTIWRSITLAKKILEFFSKCPEWINYNKNLEEHLQNLRRKMDNLEGVQADVETQLENTENQGNKKRKREVDHWLTSVKQKAVEVRNVENDTNSVCYLPRFLFRAWLGSCITKEIQQLIELLEQGRFPEGLLLDVPQDGRDPFVPSGLVGQVTSEKLDQIWANLINPRIVRIGVQAPEGIGKSAIMAQVYNRLCQCYRVYYVNVPLDFTVFTLQDAIAAEMKVNLPSEGCEKKRASRLFKVLSKKEYVLILDGLSEVFHWEEVGIPIEGNGQKLILTSRSLSVCRRMSCQETVVLESLSSEDSENLFMEKLVLMSPLNEDVRDVAREIVARCNGIPSRLITMAVQLRGVSDINEWRTTLSEM